MVLYTGLFKIVIRRLLMRLHDDHLCCLGFAFFVVPSAFEVVVALVSRLLPGSSMQNALITPRLYRSRF